MIRREKNQTAKTGEIISKSVDFEVTIADIARRSERRAWWTAFSAIVMALILACGYFLMLPLKEKVPYLVMADAYTGTSTVAKLRMDFNTNAIFSSEAINKSNVSHFVVARESFDRDNLIRRRDWTTVNAMAAPNIRQVYRSLFDRANPQNLFTAYPSNEAIRINLISVQLAGTPKIQVGKDAPQSSATVRFQRLLFNKENGTSKVLDTNIAAIQFTYRDDLEMEEALRMENPLGFWVTGYRVDKEFINAPPPTQQVEEATALPAGAANPAGTPVDPAAAANPAAANPAVPGATPAAPGAAPAATPTPPSP